MKGMLSVITVLALALIGGAAVNGSDTCVQCGGSQWNPKDPPYQAVMMEPSGSGDGACLYWNNNQESGTMQLNNCLEGAGVTFEGCCEAPWSAGGVGGTYMP